MPPSTPAGQPLSPGTVTAHNTWNQTQSCPAGPAISQPLGPLSSWNASLSIPTQLFMGKPDGTYIDQSYHVSPNGTFSVSDDHGNSFSLTVPSLLPGVSETTLVGNSTTAVLEIRIATASLTLADTKLTFSVYDQFCRPAGVRLVITGSADWGQTGRGVVALAFQKKPISLSGDRAYFGNSSGVALGFDWNDSQSL
ncbi:MAG TPA: hypothetical protein VJR06_07260, partial [Nitrososphaerales archaeon]|nr:hypothetical protein [Nitrososphaerales archaeon]